MNVIVLYVLPVADPKFIPLAAEFVETYRRFDPGHDHSLWVICNGGDPSPEHKAVFAGIPCMFVPRSNDGYDIGAYQESAVRIIESGIACDLIVCFGTSTYLKCHGWLKRMVESFVSKGDTLFGTMGNTGDAKVNVMPHIRSTAFWLSPNLFNRYPYNINNPDYRYGFEHGAYCMTSWVKSIGKQPLVVTRDGEYTVENWDKIPNGFHRGDQSNLLAGDRISRPPFYHIA